MARKSTLKKPQPLTTAIIAYMQAGEERGDAQCAGLRVRCLASGQKVFFYRYRARDGALREIRLGEVGPLTLTKARDWLQKWADYLEALTAHNVVPLRAA